MRIGILTSGGDAPGMNACIEAIYNSLSGRAEIIGFIAGLKGVYEKQFLIMKREYVEEIHKRGGSILKSSRFGDQFLKKDVQERSISNLKELGIDFLIVIGGNGSMKAAEVFRKGIKTLFIPATIDNDVEGMESIGFDTALNNAMEAIDRVRDSAKSHDRHFIVEVMGNQSGNIAYNLMLSSNSPSIIKEAGVDINTVCQKMREDSHSVVIFSEALGDVEEYRRKIEGILGEEVRTTTLGHIQRGGTPSARDRILATLYGIRCAEKIRAGLDGIVHLEDINKIDLNVYQSYLTS